MRDKPRPGRPAEAMTPTMMANVVFFDNKDRRVTLQEAAYNLSPIKRRHIRFYTKY